LNLSFNLTKLRRRLIRLIRQLLHKGNIDLVKYSDFERIKSENTNLLSMINKHESLEYDKKFLQYLDPWDDYNLSSKLSQSNSSELHQDLFVLSTLKLKRNGFFIEFGATNGIDGSNTFLLERDFGWSGILAEPAKGWHVQLQNNRPKAQIEFNCVWKDSYSKISFKEIPDAPGLSTISSFVDSDLHANSRKHGKEYKVDTISLNDLLQKFSAPLVIDYLSIDTEGTELEILKDFNFNDYKINIITCEHNYNSNRDAINVLLESKGFKRVFTDLSLYDDWFVNLSIEIE
jgi:FkbM family methyltransferase